MNKSVITIDIHGLTSDEAKRQLLGRINRANAETEKIVVIHGCNNGTVLRDMVRKQIRSNRILEIAPTFLNDGQTTIYLKKGNGK